MASFGRNAILTAIVLGQGCSTRPAPQDAIVREVDSLVEAARDERNIPGLALTILREDDPLIARGYGLADMEAPEAVTEQTVFQLGSISKQFVAALVLALVEDGRLSLDHPVSRHLPDFPQLPPSVGVAHLLNHTSGLRDLFLLPEAQAAFDDLTRSRRELEAFVRTLPVDFPPGSRWSYSNTNYVLLSLLVERITGMPYAEALAERLFRPLGLLSLRQCESLPQSPGEAHGHELHAGAVTAAAPENMNWILGEGGLCGNALDVARWTRLLATGRVIAPARYEHMIAPTRLSDGREVDYGFGLSRVPLDGVPKVAHNGAMRGYYATAAYYPGAELTIVVLANRGDARTEAIERRLARHLLDLPPAALRGQPLPGDAMRRYAGSYDIGLFDIQVRERDGQLWLEVPPPGPTTPLMYMGDREFAGTIDPDAYRVSFGGGDGATGTVRLLMGAMYWYGSRRP